MDDGDPGGFQRLDLVLAAPLGAADNGAGVAHAFALGGRQPGDEAKDGLGIPALPDVGGGAFFPVPSDLADQAHGLRLGIVPEELEDLREVEAGNRVAADAHTGALSEPLAGELVGGLIGQGAGAAHQTDGAGVEYVAGHDAQLAGPGRDDAGAVVDRTKRKELER